MRNRYKITLSISVALTLFFVLPWVSLAGQGQYLRAVIPSGNGGQRLVFLATSVFCSSLLFFQYNLFWKKRLTIFKSTWTKIVFAILINLILIVLISIVVTKLSVRSFDLKRSFFAFCLFRNMMIAGVSILVAYVYDVMEQSKQDGIKYLQLHNEKVQAELAMLKTQIDPHFLFNSLNSLTGVIRVNQKEAIHFVNHLSGTFRYALDHRKSSLASLQQELSFLDSYLYMMKVRFGNGLTIERNVNEKYLVRKIPHYGLQILVENAVKHNIVSEKRPLTISITARESYIEVKNNLQLKNYSMKGYGIGLANLAKHYELLDKPPIEIVRTETEFRVNLYLL